MERLTVPDVRVDEHTTRRSIIDGNAVREHAMEIYWRLKDYEDTGLTPDEINDLASVREISPEAEYAINKHADSIIERLDKLLAQTDDDVRLRELAEADKDGRLVVLPCNVGDTVYRIFNPPSREPVISAHTLMSVDYIVRWIDKFGKTVFLTREEAEKALEAMKDE